MKKLIVVATLAMLALQVHAAPSNAGIEAFNKALSDATTQMDNTAAMALWEEDGISLLPSTEAIIGKKAIAAFMDQVTKQLVGARMKQFEMRCFNIERAGDWATEWCDEHQIVDLGEGKQPFDGRGHMLLVLHRNADGKWRLKREMWNQAPKN